MVALIEEYDWSELSRLLPGTRIEFDRFFSTIRGTVIRELYPYSIISRDEKVRHEWSGFRRYLVELDTG